MVPRATGYYEDSFAYSANGRDSEARPETDKLPLSDSRNRLCDDCDEDDSVMNDLRV